MPLKDLYGYLLQVFSQYYQPLSSNNQQLLMNGIDFLLNSLTYLIPNIHHKDIIVEGINSISKLLTFIFENLKCLDSNELSPTYALLRYQIFILIQFEVFLEKISGGFGGRKIQSLVIFLIELIKGISRLYVLFTKQESAGMIIKWGKAYPHCIVTIDDYITWCEMNVQKYVTQHFKFLFTNSSSTIYTDSRTSLDSFNQVPFDNENILDEENNNEIDEEERKSLQIRFISVSSVSSSAFTTNHTTDDTNSDSINAKESLFSRKRRERSNTLERLEEEKRVRWLDEHSGALVSSFDTTLSLPSETLTYIHFHHLPDALFTSSSLKLSPSFELLAISSPTRHQEKIRSTSSSGNTTPEEFLVGTGTGYDSNDEPNSHESTLSAVTHPNGITTIVNLVHHDLPPQEVKIPQEECFGKILLKGKLLPRSKNMKRKSKPLVPNPSPSPRSETKSSSISPSNSTFLFSRLPSPTFNKGNSTFDFSESEKIPIIGSIASFDIDAGQILMFGEVLYILRPVIYSLMLTQLSTSQSTEPIRKFSVEQILLEETKKLPIFKDTKDKEKFVALAISMIIELISIICTMTAVRAIKEEAISQCKLEMREYLCDQTNDATSSCTSSSSSSSTSSQKKLDFDNLISAERCIPKHPIDEEIKRRKILYLLNLLKTPLFNRATLPILTRIVQTIHRVPIIGSLPDHMLETLCYINSTYFHTSNSSA